MNKVLRQFKHKNMSQLSTGSVRDFFKPESCFLNLDDDDEGTLNLVCQFTDTYLTRQASENELGCGDAGDSSSSDTDSDSGCVNVPFELRDEDSDVQRFRDSCRLDDSKSFL